MSATLSPLLHESDLKEYLIFRVDETRDREELADESALESEANRYANFRAEVERQSGVHYEVRRAEGGGLRYSTEDYKPLKPLDEEPSWRLTAT